ncbi:MAG: glycosyltransferase family 2 protein [Bacteroidales bacterium]|nr:glycosyltransferase family 2 protein [Bacteroidales bacterium]
MFGFYISLPFLLFALYRLFIVLYNYFTRPFLPVGVPKDNPLVSIVVPVNPDNNVKNLLLGLCNQTYRNLEILVYCDKVNSISFEIIQDFSKADGRVKFVEASTIPEGWIAKNYIYDFVSQLFKGQYIIFVDADIVVEKEIVANALSYMQLNDLSLLTMFPKQVSASQWDKALDYTKYWTLLSMTPLKIIMSSKKGSLSINDKRFMMFEASSYKSKRWHEKYKGFQGIDFVIGRYLKKSQLKIAALLCNNEIVFTPSNDSLENPSLFFFNFFGRNKNRLITFTIFTTLGFLFAIFLLPFPLVFLYLFSIIFARLMFAMLYGKSTIITLLLLPIHHIVFVYTVVRFIKTKGNVVKNSMAVV